MPTVELKSVTVKYESKKRGTVVALNNFSALFKSDAFSVIVGYSGCGKTTLLKAISGIQPFTGSVTIGGEDATSMSAAQRNIAYVAQDYLLYPHMTIFENIAFPLSVAGAGREEIMRRVNALAEKLGITDCLSRKPRHISGGQQQRAALARAMVKRPSLVLMDEPLSNIDAPARAAERVFLKTFLRETGCTAIYVTHDPREAMALADELFVMDGGRLEISGAPLEVFNSGNAVVKSLFEEL